MTGPRPAGAGFDVNVDGASQAIKELEDALVELSDIHRASLELGRITPPSADSVSRDAALVLQNTATEGKASFAKALEEGIAQLRSTIDALKVSMPAYREGDRAAALPTNS